MGSLNVTYFVSSASDMICILEIRLTCNWYQNHGLLFVTMCLMNAYDVVCH